MMKKTTLMIALAAMTSLNLFAAEPQTILPCPENVPLKWRMEGAGGTPRRDPLDAPPERRKICVHRGDEGGKHREKTA